MYLLLLALFAACSAQDPSSCSNAPDLPLCSSSPSINCPDNAFGSSGVWWYDFEFDCAPTLFVPSLNGNFKAVWVKWTAPASSDYVVSTISTKTTFDAQISGYTTCPSKT